MKIKLYEIISKRLIKKQIFIVILFAFVLLLGVSSFYNLLPNVIIHNNFK